MTGSRSFAVPEHPMQRQLRPRPRLRPRTALAAAGLALTAWIVLAAQAAPSHAAALCGFVRTSHAAYWENCTGGPQHVLQQRSDGSRSPECDAAGETWLGPADAVSDASTTGPCAPGEPVSGGGPLDSFEQG
ncbi:hypothetical protein [Phaeacidiphilus oryzae]|uniref:hypothetical protein n=1 Tax=Phaeacidiphilus oryzae TaxID=348818 RepID=UPI00068C71F5|nr:hypothetical protein [Phaeacidiphilus oryzae]